MLTQERVRELFTYHDGHLYWKEARSNIPAGRKAGWKGKCHYYVSIDERKWGLHQLVWLWHFGTLPPLIDHINRDGHDNRISNLRAASFAQNSMNAKKRSNTSSRYKGVSYNRRKGAYYAWI